MAAEVHSDLTLIQDEDVLRRMWADTEDFGRKKEIRARMYKLREQRLKDIYTVGDVSHVTRKHQTTRHTESIGDQGFLTMKTKEIRDSESPTRDFSRSMITSNTGNDGYWTSRQERSNVTENLEGGGILKETLNKSEGSGVIKDARGDTELALGSENRHTVVTKTDDNSSYHGEAKKSSSQMSSVTKSDGGVSQTSKAESHLSSKSQEEKVSPDGMSSSKSWSSSHSTSSRTMTKSSYTVTSDGQRVETVEIPALKSVEDSKRETQDSTQSTESRAQIRRSDESSTTARQSETVNREKVVSTSQNSSYDQQSLSKVATSDNQFKSTEYHPSISSQQNSSYEHKTSTRTVTSDDQGNADYIPSERITTPKESTEREVIETKSVESETKNRSTVERTASETESVTNQKILSEIQKLDSYLSTHTGASTPVSPQSMTDVSKWTIVTKDNTDNEFTYEPRAPNSTPQHPPSSPRSHERVDKNQSNLELPKEATDGQYVTTYQSHYTRPERISVDLSPSHDYFASTLRSSPDRQTPSPTKKTGSRGSLDRSSPERKWRQSPRSVSSPSSDRAGPGTTYSRPKERSPEDKGKPVKGKTPERTLRSSPAKSPERDRRPSSGSYTIERPKSETRRKSESKTDNKPKRKFSSTQQKQATKARASTPGTSPTRSPERKSKHDSSDSDSDDSHATFKKSKSDVRTTNEKIEKTTALSKKQKNLSKEESSEYYSEESITNELIRKKHETSPERSAFTPIKNFRTNPESGTFIAGEKRQITTQEVRTTDEEHLVNVKDNSRPSKVPNQQPATENDYPVDEALDMIKVTEKKQKETEYISEPKPYCSQEDLLVEDTKEHTSTENFIKQEQHESTKTTKQNVQSTVEITESTDNVLKTQERRKVSSKEDTDRTRRPKSSSDKSASPSPERKASSKASSPERKTPSSPTRTPSRKPDSDRIKSPSSSPERAQQPRSSKPSREPSKSPDKLDRSPQRKLKSPERVFNSPQRATSPVKSPERRTPEKTPDRKLKTSPQAKPVREIPTRVVEKPSSTRQTPRKPVDSPDNGKVVRRSSIPKSESRFTPKKETTKPYTTKERSTPTQPLTSPNKVRPIPTQSNKIAPVKSSPVRPKTVETVPRRSEQRFTSTITHTKTTSARVPAKSLDKPKQTSPTKPTGPSTPRQYPASERKVSPKTSSPVKPKTQLSSAPKTRTQSSIGTAKKPATSSPNQVKSKNTTDKTYNQVKSKQFIEVEACDECSDLEDTAPPHYFDVEVEDIDEEITTNVNVKRTTTSINKSKHISQVNQDRVKTEKPLKKRDVTGESSSSESEEEDDVPTEKRDTKHLQPTHDYLNVVVQHPKSSRESSPGYPSEKIPLSTTSDDGESNPRYADFVSEPEDVEIFDTLRGPRGPIPSKQEKIQKIEIEEDDISRSSVADKVNVFLEAAKNSLETQESVQPIDIDKSHSVKNAKNLFENISKTQSTVVSSSKTVNLFENEKEKVDGITEKIATSPIKKPSVHVPDDIESPATKIDMYQDRTEVVEQEFVRKKAYETERRDLFKETTDFKQHEIDDRTTVRKDTPIPEPLSSAKPSKKPFVRNPSATNVDVNSKRNFFEKKVQEQVKPQADDGVRSPGKKTPEKPNTTKTGSFMKSTAASSARTSTSERQQVRAQTPEKRVKSPVLEKPQRAQSPEKQVRAKSPEKHARAKSPEKHVRRPSSPEKQVRSSSPEKQTRAHSPEKIVKSTRTEKQARPLSPEKQTRAHSPEKLARVPSPDKFIRGQSPEKEPRYQQPTRAQSPEKFVRPTEDRKTTHKTSEFTSTSLLTREPIKTEGYERKTSSTTSTIRTVEKPDFEASPVKERPLRTTSSFDEADDMRSTVVNNKSISTLEETTKTSGKFGVTLRKTPSSTKMTPTAPVSTPKKASITRESVEIEDIYDLEILEMMLIKAVAYEERRRIRSQLRLVKKQLEEEHNKIGIRPTTSTPTKNKQAPGPKEKSPERVSTITSVRSREDRQNYGTEDRLTRGTKKSPERRLTTEIRQSTFTSTTSTTVQDRDSAEKRSSVTKSRESPERRSSKPRVKESPEKIVRQLGRTSPERKVSAPTADKTTLVPAKTDVTTYQATVKTHTTRNVTSEVKEVSATDSITSSYGVGPTDDNGKPLFGLRALRRTNTNKTLTGESEEDENVENIDEITRDTVTEDILDYSGRPLFGGLRALQTDAMPAQTDRTELIENNQQLRGSSVMESRKTVVTSHSSISSDGKVSHKRNVVKGELMAKNGEQPVGKITKSTYSYRKDGESDSTPQITSKTVTSVIGGRRSSGPVIEEITDGSQNASCSRRYSKEYTVEEDCSSDRRRSSTGIVEDKDIGYSSILKNREGDHRKSSLETTETETRTTRYSQDGTTGRTLTRGDSIKALQHKYQQATVSSSMKQATTVQSTRSTDLDGAVVTSSQTKTSEDATTVRTTSGNSMGLSQITSSSQGTTTTTTRSDMKSSGPSSFLDNSSKVTGVQDILTRMRNADLVSETGDSTEDAEARALLNKFLGASVILQGMEQGMKAASSQSSTSLVNEVDKQWVKATNQRSRDDDINDIYDEKQLQILLDSSSDYEERRKIRARLREVMAEKKGGTGERCPPTTSTEGELSTIQRAFGLDDSGTESGEDLRHLNPEVVEEVKSALSRLESVIPGLDPTKRDAVFQLVANLQNCLQMTPQTPPPIPPPRRFGSRKALKNRHTVGVTTDELAAARKWVERDNMQRESAASTESILSKVFRPVKFAPPAPLPESYSKMTVVRKLYHKPILHKPDHFMEQPPQKGVLTYVEPINDVSYDYDPSVHLFTPEQTVQIAIHKAAINKQINRDKTRGSSEDGDVSSGDDDESNSRVSTVKRLLHLATADDKKPRFNGKTSKKAKMKRANTVDIPKPSKYIDYSSDDYGGASADEIKDDTSRRIASKTILPPNFIPKTENDHKFLTFLRQVSNKSPPKVQSYNPSARGGQHWQNRFSSIKTTFEIGDKKGHVENNAQSAAKLFWQNTTKGDKGATVKLPWTVKSGENGVVVGSLTVAKPGHINRFNHAPVSAFKPVEKKQLNSSSGSVKQLVNDKFTPVKNKLSFQNTATKFDVKETRRTPSAFATYKQKTDDRISFDSNQQTNKRQLTTKYDNQSTSGFIPLVKPIAKVYPEPQSFYAAKISNHQTTTQKYGNYKHPESQRPSSSEFYSSKTTREQAPVQTFTNYKSEPRPSSGEFYSSKTTHEQAPAQTFTNYKHPEKRPSSSEFYSPKTIHEQAPVQTFTNYKSEPRPSSGEFYSSKTTNHEQAPVQTFTNYKYPEPRPSSSEFYSSITTNQGQTPAQTFTSYKYPEPSPIYKIPNLNYTNPIYETPRQKSPKCKSPDRQLQSTSNYWSPPLTTVDKPIDDIVVEIGDTRILESEDTHTTNLAAGGPYICNLRDASTINTDGEFVSNVMATSPGLRDSHYISPRPKSKSPKDPKLNGWPTSPVDVTNGSPSDDGECKAVSRVMGQAQCQTAVTVNNRTRRRFDEPSKLDLRLQLSQSVRQRVLSPSFPNVLQKSESWHQLVKEMNQTKQAPPISPNSNLHKLSKAKSSHSLNQPKQFEAALPQDADLTTKRVTVSQYLSKRGKKNSTTAIRHKSLGNIANLQDDMDDVDEAFETIFQENNRKRNSK